ncbi:hypothetical protein [Nocardioides lijunqiniae]|uniref:hypothetical protein n=1 Tax=Nocardioides lijunqiniae TaxID=2760832 RepID=UPI001878F797|nr:hypothetical protein [Nocardioides lijunqiniae]
MTESFDEAGPLACAICSALVPRVDVSRHADWHERLVDDVVSAVKVRLEDPPRS